MSPLDQSPPFEGAAARGKTIGASYRSVKYQNGTYRVFEKIVDAETSTPLDLDSLDKEKMAELLEIRAQVFRIHQARERG